MLTTLINPAILEEGLKKGKEEGLKEGKLDVAKKMLAEGIVIPLVIKLTELTEEEILKLKEELSEKKH
jgi:predicted transposase/invertase (TIGR01784 family)